LHLVTLAVVCTFHPILTSVIFSGRMRGRRGTWLSSVGGYGMISHKRAGQKRSIASLSCPLSFFSCKNRPLRIRAYLFPILQIDIIFFFSFFLLLIVVNLVDR